MEPERIIIKKPDSIRNDIILPIEIDESALGFDKIEEEIKDIKKELKIKSTSSLDKNIIVNNKVNAITNLINSIGELKYTASHLNALINEEADIKTIQSNWLVIGTVDDEGNVIPEQIELRKEEFELFCKE